MTQRSSLRREDFRRAVGLSDRDGFTAAGRRPSRIARITQALTGATPTAFQAAVLPTAALAIDAQTPRFQLPAPRSPQTTVGDVVLNRATAEFDGRHVIRESGAFSGRMADRAYSAGRLTSKR